MGVFMKNLILVLALSVIVPLTAFGQSEDEGITWRANIFGAPGYIHDDHDSSGTIHLGIGSELDFYKGLGIDVEIGYIGVLKLSGLGVGCASLNGRYSFNNNSDARIVPFVTAGPSWFGSGGPNAANFGGGIKYRLNNRFGLNLEFRDHLALEDEVGHIIEGRVGLTIRLLDF